MASQLPNSGGTILLAFQILILLSTKMLAQIIEFGIVYPLQSRGQNKHRPMRSTQQYW